MVNAQYAHMEILMTLSEALSQPTISVPEAGSVFFGISRDAAYTAARNGEIPTIKIGKKFRVPVAPLAEKLGLRATFGNAV